MRRYILTLVLIALAFSMCFAKLSVDISMPKEVKKGSEFDIVIKINPDGYDKFDVAEFIPNDWAISNWYVSGAKKSDVSFDYTQKEFQGKNYLMNHWAVSNPFGDVVLTLKIKAKDTGDFTFRTLWIYPEGFDSEEHVLKVVQKEQNTRITGGYLFNSESTSKESKNTEKVVDIKQNFQKINSLFSMINI